MQSLRPETEVAIQAARRAVEIADSRTDADQRESKGGIDLVTGTDLACEDAIREDLLEALPDYPVVGEERGGVPVDGTPYWLVDPICGTRMFASNVPLYCTNIALVEEHAVTVAAVGIGQTGEIMLAEKGSGAWMRTGTTERRLDTSEESNTVWVGAPRDRMGGVVDRLLSTGHWYVLLFPSTLGSAYLAAGRISGVIHIGHRSVRHGSVHTAAGCLLASEAGALVTDLEDNRPWSLETGSFLMAASPSLHRELRDLLQSILPPTIPPT